MMGAFRINLRNLGVPFHILLLLPLTVSGAYARPCREPQKESSVQQGSSAGAAEETEKSSLGSVASRTPDVDQKDVVPDWVKRLSIEGKSYLRYSYDTQGPKDDFNEFNIDRIYVGLNWKVGEKARLRYTPWTRVPHIPYKTPITEAACLEGAICPKGQAGLMTVYDPYRITKVLKRDGPRGSMRWKTIDLHQAVEEIVNGGKLFAHVPGEENREVTGLKNLWALRDPKLAGEMGKAVEEIWNAKTPEEKKALVALFQSKFKDHLDVLIDPEHPDLGPRNNQFLTV